MTTARRRIGAIAVAAIIVVASLQAASAASAAVTIVDRLAGADRYATSARISAAAFAPGVSVAFIASGAAFPDALSGAAAAGTRSAPVLLTHPETLPAVVAAELDRLDPAEIIVLGGEGAVSDSVAEALEAFTAGPVERIAGADRYETSAAISAQMFPAGAAVAYLANGAVFPDALSAASVASGVGGPILLTETTSLPETARLELERLRPSTLIVLGGTGAVADDVAGAAAAAAGASLERLAGPDRYATSAAISSATFPAGVPIVYLASGLDFPDALSGAAAARGAPLLLTAPGAIPASIAQELWRLRPARVVILGGPGAVSATVETLAAIVASELPPASGARLTKETEIGAGTCLASTAAAHQLCVNTDGSFGVYRAGIALWTSGTTHPAPRALRLRDDGSVILYSVAGQVIWESGTPRTTAAELVVQDDGDLMLRGAGGAILWSSMSSDTAPRWRLPFASGQSWAAGGPHGPSNGIGARGSLDLGPRTGGDRRVLTIADGTVFQITCGTASYLGIRHAGGWESTYYHLVNEQRQLIGTTVPAGTYLGDVGRTLPCGGGATFDHVHLSIRHAGTTVSVEGMTFGGYTVRGSGQGYWGTWTNAAGQTVVTARGGAACCLVAP